MRYIGCKRRLLPFIHATVKKYAIEGKWFCDLFSGTATVGNYFKREGYKIISNDFLYCSYVQQKVKIGINVMPTFEYIAEHLKLIGTMEKNFIQEVINYLNQLNGIEGFIYKNYSAGGTRDTGMSRLYYTDENAKKIDAIRETIEEWRQLNLINEDEFYILLHALLDEASNCSNTPASMNSFLKFIYPKAQRTIHLRLPEITHSFCEHEVYCQNSLSLLNKLNVVDILYLDPPYTANQYIASYHILETIARWDAPSLQGITGRREMLSLSSTLSTKKQALKSLEYILANARYRHLLMSYSSDGLVPHEALLQSLQNYGHVIVHTQKLRRYNSLPPDHPHYDPDAVVEERLYYLKPFFSMPSELTMAS